MLAINYCQYLANNKLSIFYYLLANIFFFFGLLMMYLLYLFVICLNICVNFELYVNSFCIVLCFFLLQVVDVLIHHTRSLLLSHSEQPQSKTLFSLTRNLFPYFPRRSITLGRCFYHNVAGVDVCNCINPDVLDVEVQRTAVMIYEDNVEVYDSSFPTSAQLG